VRVLGDHDPITPALSTEGVTGTWAYGGGMRVVVLTGAGVSAESGLPTFRDARGLWEGHRPEQVATPEAYAEHPDLVHRFYDARRAALATVEPNAAHRALARLEDALGDDCLIVTQNIDDLHERGGSARVVHIHGELRAARCVACETTHRWQGDLGHRPACPVCGRPELRPDVVWFGEVPHRMSEVFEAVAFADVFCAVGTSGLVFPAAGLGDLAAAHGAHTVELNLEASAVSSDFRDVREGPATVLVPAWVEELLGAQ
jgi:NAD-dependent deacetylase